MRREQCFNFLSQRLVIAASFRQKSRSSFPLPPEGGREKLVNLLPAFGAHYSLIC
jgi:hypothetical protein